jgi:hypothetical protein
MPTSLLALLDDIALLLDDVATLTKVATKKTAGVLGDDLALNAQQVAGVDTARELPVVWAVAKGSALNKVILVPMALALSTLVPRAVTPALMLGGLYLCYEGVEKLVHWYLHRGNVHAEEDAVRRAQADRSIDPVAHEREKIRGAIRTDFILSAEIITISLATVATAPFGTRLAVLVAVSVLMTVGVYGLVAGIVKLDDLGLSLHRRSSPIVRALGRAVLVTAPWLMKFLSIAGMAAMFLVGGGILRHGMGPVERAINGLLGDAQGATTTVRVLHTVATTVLDGAIGILAGSVALALVLGIKRLSGKPA